MKSLLHRLCVTSGLVFGLVALVTLTPDATFASVGAGPATVPPDPVRPGALANGASLHNPGFDNHIWYWFGDRYSYGDIADKS